jgi:predicted MPP superfamily phosphohydrolase
MFIAGAAGLLYIMRHISRLVVKASLFIALVILIYAAFMFYVIAIEPNTISVIHTYIDLPDLEDGMTIAFITDTHLGAGSSEVLEAAVEAANAENPDFILLGGDYIDPSQSNVSGLSFLGNLSADKGIYAVMGNHDYDNYGISCPDSAGISKGKAVSDKLRSMDIRVLSNEAVELSDSVVLAGLDDYWACKSSYSLASNKTTYTKTADGVEKYTTRILLTHNQDAVPPDELTEWNLVLAGHTHCGQVRLPFVGSIMKNFFGFSGEYDKGHYKLGNDSHIYTTCGVGGFPMRFLAPPEVSILHLS